MRWRWAGVVATLVATGGWLARPLPAAIPMLSGNLVSLFQVRPSLTLVRDLGLPDADQYALQVLDHSPTELLLLYPEDADPIDTAARWSLALSTTGMKKTDDWSRPGRTVLRFRDGDETALLAVGRTTRGPFAVYTAPAAPGHWVTRPDAEAPEVLRSLLPIPAPP